MFRIDLLDHTPEFAGNMQAVEVGATSVAEYACVDGHGEDLEDVL